MPTRMAVRASDGAGNGFDNRLERALGSAGLGLRRQVHPAWLLLPLAIALGVLGYQHQKAFEAAQHKSSIQRGTNDLLDRASGQKPW